MSEESIFYQDGEITVTNARFIVGARTFAVRGITSVEGVETPKSYTLAVLLVLLGLLFSVIGFTGGINPVGVFGIIGIGIGVFLAVRQKTIYAIVLKTAGGDVTAYQSNSKDRISQIIQALNNSIISTSN